MPVAGVGWEEGGERDLGHRGAVHPCPATGHCRAPLPTISSAADAESQDPDSTNSLESEAPRDYFLKCKWPPGLSLLFTPGPPKAVGLSPGTRRPGFPPPSSLGRTGSALGVLSGGAEACWSLRSRETVFGEGGAWGRGCPARACA